MFVSASAWIAVAPLNPANAAVTEADYRACQAEDVEAFRKAIEAITAKALAGGLKGLDYEAIVRDEWRKRDLDSVIHARVDLATSDVRSKSSWASLLESLAFRERAKELATAVAERVYRSDAVTQAITELSNGVGERIGQSIELTTVDAAGPAQRCVKDFLGTRYGSTVAQAVEEDAAEAFRVTPGSGEAAVGAGGVLLESAGGLTGAVVLLVRRQVAQMANRLGQRMVGVVLGRIVSVAAGGVGLALIAKDVWDLRYGMLPIIASEMKSSDTIGKVQAELASSIKEQISQHTDELARATSDRIVGIWRSFQAAHTKVLELAEADAQFREFVDTVGKTNLPKLDEVVSLILTEHGENGVGRALRNGDLNTAMTTLDDHGLAIARDRRSLDAGLKWTTLADTRLPDVIALGLHQRAKPEDFSRPTLIRLLDLENRAAQLKLASIPRDDRAILFELDNEKLSSLGRGLAEDELQTLSRYLRGLSRPASQVVLAAVAASPAKMKRLASDGVRSAIIDSHDQSAAVEMLLRTGGGLQIGDLAADIQKVTTGDVHPRLIWEAHPIVVVALGVLALLLLLVIRGLFLGRRKPPAAPPAQGVSAAPSA